LPRYTASIISYGTQQSAAFAIGEPQTDDLNSAFSTSRHVAAAFNTDPAVAKGLGAILLKSPDGVSGPFQTRAEIDFDLDKTSLAPNRRLARNGYAGVPAATPGNPLSTTLLASLGLPEVSVPEPAFAMPILAGTITGAFKRRRKRHTH
jgi:hypothetical protein